MDLFDSFHTGPGGVPEFRAEAPLTVRIHPRSLDELVDREHLSAQNSPLHRLLSGQTDTASSVIPFGLPGAGKTTLAFLVAQAGGREYVRPSVTNAGIRETRKVTDSAKRRLNLGDKRTILFLDEVHRFSRSQQDSSLSTVENHWTVLATATTENLTFSMISPLLSRSLFLNLRPLDTEAISTIVERALTDSRGLRGKLRLTEAAREAIVRLADSNGRKSLALLEVVAGGAASRGAGEIIAEDVATAADTAIMRYNINEHYGMASTFIGSMHGSDPGATLHYLACMVRGGEDPHFIARRVVITAAEDVGPADPIVLPLAAAAAQAVQLIGIPEGRIPLTEAVVAMATTPKSDRAYLGIDAALNSVDCGDIGRVLTPLRDQHLQGAKEARKTEGGYRYPHDDPRGVLSRWYLPDELRDRIYYQPSSHGCKAAIGEQLAKLRLIQKMRQNIRVAMFGVCQAPGNNREQDSAPGVLTGVLTPPVER